MTDLRLSPSTLLFALICASCASAPPSPERPDFAVSSESFATDEVADISRSEIDAEWWTGFDDPLLADLVEEALVANKDLEVAAANVETVRARLQRQLLEQSYSTASTASAEAARAAVDGADIDVTGRGQLGASWEFDAYGAIAAQIESAMFEVERSQELRRDVAVTVAAETALAYVDYRGNQVRLRVAQSNAELQGESVELLRVLFDNGRATRLDVERAEAQYRTTLASLPLLEIGIQTAAINLATLTGRTDFRADPRLVGEATDAIAIPRPPLSLNISTPQDLIRRRPDIRAAEANIARLSSLGTVERARLFPTLTFDANLLALFTEDNVGADSFGFGIGPGLRWEGPDLRHVRADIDVSDAQTRVAFAEYERTVVQALGEVEIALVTYGQERSRRNDLEAAAASADRALELARLRFDKGLDDFLDVIDAQRTRLDAQDRLESNRLATTRQAIAAYRALGGIWQDERFAQARSENE